MYKRGQHLGVVMAEVGIEVLGMWGIVVRADGGEDSCRGDIFPEFAVELIELGASLNEVGMHTRWRTQMSKGH